MQENGFLIYCDFDRACRDPNFTLASRDTIDSLKELELCDKENKILEKVRQVHLFIQDGRSEQGALESNQLSSKPQKSNKDDEKQDASQKTPSFKQKIPILPRVSTILSDGVMIKKGKLISDILPKNLAEADFQIFCARLKECSPNPDMFLHNSGKSLLEVVAQKGDLNKVKFLVEEMEAKDFISSLETNVVEEVPTSALYEAARYCHTQVVEYLSARGARADLRINPKGDGYYAPLFPCLLTHYCPDNIALSFLNKTKSDKSKEVECIKTILNYLVESERDRLLNESRSVYGMSPSEIAIMYGRKDLLEVLLAYGANWVGFTQVKERDKALLQAVREGYLDIAQWLFENFRMEVNCKLDTQQIPDSLSDGYVATPVGTTLLHIAADTENPEMVQLLLKEGANREEKNEFGENYLVYANRRKSERAIFALYRFARFHCGLSSPIDKLLESIRNEDLNITMNDSDGDTNSTLLYFVAQALERIKKSAAEWPNTRGANDRAEQLNGLYMKLVKKGAVEKLDGKGLTPT